MLKTASFVSAYLNDGKGWRTVAWLVSTICGMAFVIGGLGSAGSSAN